MSYTLSNLIVDCLVQIGKINLRVATGGGTTSAVDSTLANIELSDGDYVGGYLFVVDTTDGLTPKGQYKKISAFTASTGTFTTSAFTDAIGAGDTFGYVTSPVEYDINEIIRLVNIGLEQLGDIILVDTTTLDTASNQTEYAASLVWKRNKPFRIDFQGNINDANDNRWYQVTGWDWIPASPGTTGLIVFHDQPVASRGIRIWYQDRHPEVNTYEDVIAETIHPNLARVAALERILFQKNAQKNGSDSTVKEMYNWASQQLALEKESKAVVQIKTPNKIMSIARNSDWQNHIQPPDAV